MDTERPSCLQWPLPRRSSPTLAHAAVLAGAAAVSYGWLIGLARQQRRCQPTPGDSPDLDDLTKIGLILVGCAGGKGRSIF